MVSGMMVRARTQLIPPRLQGLKVAASVSVLGFVSTRNSPYPRVTSRSVIKCVACIVYVCAYTQRARGGGGFQQRLYRTCVVMTCARLVVL
jgi:hypothetical protein